ncbi:hypothetical protein CDCA_CDCA15G3961 [Cyanidium caldarium]|uniref:PPPDE domain-containing protein n=1 Tax=Cyanidium caldarium TaxID=2771 RepID=A0AAV9J0M7_CYACA|nr:hypothetical protein CDCA_CDCA15G3961 [Cyanidium caldarium]
MTRHRVILHVYDLSGGLAAQFSTMLLGKRIEAVYHTGVVVYGREYYFGGGIQSAPPGGTVYGRPVRAVDMGETGVSVETFRDFLQGIRGRYQLRTYHLLDRNCNHFSDEVCQFLVGRHIPQEIRDLPEEAMNSPLGSLLRPMLESLQAQVLAMDTPTNGEGAHRADGGREAGGDAGDRPVVFDAACRAETRAALSVSAACREAVWQRVEAGNSGQLATEDDGEGDRYRDELLQACTADNASDTPPSVIAALDMLRALCATSARNWIAGVDGAHLTPLLRAGPPANITARTLLAQALANFLSDTDTACRCVQRDGAETATQWLFDAAAAATTPATAEHRALWWAWWTAAAALARAHAHSDTVHSEAFAARLLWALTHDTAAYAASTHLPDAAIADACGRCLLTVLRSCAGALEMAQAFDLPAVLPQFRCGRTTDAVRALLPEATP